jgi:hypothetical protein
MVKGSPDLYPGGNFFPPSLEEVGFVDYAGGDYRLRAGSRYSRLTVTGADIGTDFDALQAALGPMMPASRQYLTQEKQSWLTLTEQPSHGN